MTHNRVRLTFLILIVVCVILPIIMTVLRVWEPFWIAVGLLLAFFLSRGLSIVSADMAQQAESEAFRPSPNTSHTIYVELVDERGALLPKEERDRRMEEAYRKAGPRDVVVPVKKKG